MPEFLYGIVPSPEISCSASILGAKAPAGSILTRVWEFSRDLASLDSLSVFPGVLAGTGKRRIDSDQVEFSPIQEFPLDLFPRLQADGGGQRDWEIDVELGFLSFGADGLHFE